MTALFSCSNTEEDLATTGRLFPNTENISRFYMSFSIVYTLNLGQSAVRLISF